MKQLKSVSVSVYICILSSVIGQIVNCGFHNCEFLIDSDRPPFEPICEGLYNRELKLKYRDKWVSQDTNYRIWGANMTKRRIFITFYQSELWKCSTNITCSLNWLHCENNLDVGITLRPDNIYCFRYMFTYARDLLHNCRAEISNEIDFLAIHYERSVPKYDDFGDTGLICNLCSNTKCWHLFQWMFPIIIYFVV
ncbi:uncharacterized protein LOC6639172 [Drosophila willistoni]|uniref:uncharacterized protein LOC6639172 n=1 Tax=Drosophila willistoni TaxID=7260 RepID=UPI001F076FA3|nr:uncharacterized protein LOC6639172 [Drosophila willistoni]